jgi:S1-C subfamily serine protease
MPHPPAQSPTRPRRLAPALALAVASAGTWLVVAPVVQAAPTRASLERGVVDITSVIRFGAGASAGTGMVVGSNGLILTNNHVIEGATSIRVRDVRTSRRYVARVLGTDATRDIAVLRLAGAKGMARVRIGDSSALDVGDGVIAVGNANGSGGHPTISRGSVVRLNRTLTVRDDDGGVARLRGLIQVDARLVPGESGGPLYDAAGRVVGMNTAAALSPVGARSAGFAIPIRRAMGVVRQVLSGRGTGTVRVGGTGFLGVQTGAAAGGVLVEALVDDGPAAEAGLRPGDLITAVDGVAVTTPAALRARITARRPGDVVTLAWTDAGGVARTARVTLGEGPA